MIRGRERTTGGLRMKRLRRWYGFVSLSFFAVASATHQVIFSRALGLSRMLSYHVLQPLSNATEVLICLLGITVAQRGRPRLRRELGLEAPVGRALAFAWLATLPMSVGFALVSKIGANVTLAALLVSTVIAPFAEEVLFRGYIFRQLYRRARWPYWPSVLAPSVLFALLHVYQAESPAELAGILSVTGIGSILLCWVFARWQDNLWAPFAIHASMNFWWELFAVDDTALGGWYANGARLATVALGVLLTLYKDRLWPRLPREDANIVLAEPAATGDASDHQRMVAAPDMSLRSIEPVSRG
jgi:CAAX protease family protein